MLFFRLALPGGGRGEERRVTRDKGRSVSARGVGGGVAHTGRTGRAPQWTTDERFKASDDHLLLLLLLLPLLLPLLLLPLLLLLLLLPHTPAAGSSLPTHSSTPPHTW